VDGHTFYFKDGNLTWIKSSVAPKLALFLYSWLNSNQGKQQLLLSTIGTSQSALTIENLKKNKLIIPSNNLIDDYYVVFDELIQQKRTLQRKNQNLAKQRDLLLPRLMSGKLEV
jgi:type I restriction enzyme S subunit